MELKDLTPLAEGIGARLGDVSVGSVALVKALVFALARQPNIDEEKLFADIRDLLENVNEGIAGEMATGLRSSLGEPSSPA